MTIWVWIWACMAVALFVGEMFTAGFFMVPFGVGAAVAGVLALLDIAVGWQWTAFLVVSTVAFLFTRRLADRITHEPPVRVGVDRLIGVTGVVIQDIQPDSGGRVRIEREEWRADAPGHGSLAEGARVTVERVEGTHLIVKPAEDVAPVGDQL